MSEFYFNPNGNFLFTQEDYDRAPTDSTKKVLPVRCLYCDKIFHISKATLKASIKYQESHPYKPFTAYRYCSVKCRRADNPRLKIVEYDCAYCGKHVKRPKWTIRQTKTGQLFCSPTCSNKWKHEHDFVREKFRADISLNPNGNFLFTQEQYEANLSPSKLHKKVLPIRCLFCGNPFYISSCDVNLMYQCKRWHTNKYCNLQCSGKANRNRITLTCDWCGKKFERTVSSVKTHTKKHFCSDDCCRKYGKEHPFVRHLNSRSKSETLFVEVIENFNPSYRFLTNDRNILDGYEIDLYIPELLVGIEFNGPTHYKNIYNNEKSFQEKQERDSKRIRRAKERRIELIVVDISDMNTLYPTTACKYILRKLPLVFEQINKARNTNFTIPEDAYDRIMQIIYDNRKYYLPPSILAKFNWNTTNVNR